MIIDIPDEMIEEAMESPDHSYIYHIYNYIVDEYEKQQQESKERKERIREMIHWIQNLHEPWKLLITVILCILILLIGIFINFFIKEVL